MKARWAKQIDEDWAKINVETNKRAVRETSKYRITASIVTYSRNGRVFDTKYCVDVEDKELDGFNLVDGFDSKNKEDANNHWKRLTAEYLMSDHVNAE